METITLQIGNTDDKLSQQAWADFYEEIDRAVCRYALKLHFYGTPPAHAPRQNACWVFDIVAQDELRERVTFTRLKFGQDSVAWTRGRTEFI